MAPPRNTDPDSGATRSYQIRVKGHLGQEWADWFEGLTVTPEADGHTLLTGPVVDQAALHGLLRKVRDLGLPLLWVVCLEPGQDNPVSVPASRPDGGEI
jgi:hypothetical protein